MSRLLRNQAEIIQVILRYKENSFFACLLNGGATVFVNPDGSIASLADDQEQLLFAELDLENTEEYRKKT